MAKFKLDPVEIRRTDNCGLQYEVLVNGLPMQRVRKVSFHVGVDELPVLEMELYSEFHLTDNAAVTETYSDDDIATAAKVMASAIRNRPEIREGFKASILSGIRDGMKDGNNATMEDFAETILRRIAG